VRTDKNRQPLRDETLKGGPTGTIGVLPPIEFGRLKIEEEIKAAATQKLAEFGIAVLDFRIKRVNYNPDVLDRIYQRMISERLQIAQRFRSEGEGQSARIAGQRERDLNEIQSNAYRRVQEIRGEADAKATEIYARAYTQNPQAAEFYAFLKTLETYHKIFSKDSTLVLSTDSDIFALLKHAATKTTGSPIPVETPAKPSPLSSALPLTGASLWGHSRKRPVSRGSLRRSPDFRDEGLTFLKNHSRLTFVLHNLESSRSPLSSA
jgi:SPFH domain / Band 7 family